MGEIFGAAGQIASAAISASAVKDATRAQTDALERQRQFVFNELEPGKISGMATAQDVDRAKQRLALQGIVDPALLQSRYAAQEKLLQQVQGIGTGEGDQIAQLAASEAAATSPQFTDLKQKLIDSALGELEAGATLPSDVQAELVKAGLEKGSLVSGSASPKGASGLLTRKLIGEGAINLQAQRQERAQKLAQTAQGLETSRASILANLFPNLKSTQLANQQASQSALTQSNQMVPEAGLGGTDIANLWLSRVGATNQLAQSAADAAARGGMSQAQIWNNALGGATKSIGSALPSTQSVFNSIFG